jgi:hypothetical protein
MKIYIPRILGGINSKMLKNTFHRLSIGDAYYIDMHRKVNENNHIYYFAFLEIEMYDTIASNSLLAKLNNNRSVNLIYDEEAGQYWELKKHVPKNERKQQQQQQQEIKMSSVMPVLYETFMSAFEHAGMVTTTKQEEPAEDTFDYDAYLQDNTFNMWDDKYNFWQSV